MLRKNPSSGRKRPTPRYKTPKGIANAKTRAAKRAGLIPQDMVPSQTRLVHRKWEDAWKARHPDYMKIWRAKRRRQRANAKALLEAPINSPEFFRAVLALPDCPRDEKGQTAFAIRKAFERAGIILPE